jgi:hypothetical protein
MHLKIKEQIFSDLDQLINTSPALPELLTETYQFVKTSIKERKTFVIISYNLPRSIFGGSALSITEDGTRVIELSSFLMKLYSSQPSIVLSIVMHEFRHTFDSFKNYHTFVTGERNALEKYLYEMDAMLVELAFIKEILVPHQYNLTGLETYLHKNNDKDQIVHISHMLLGYDMQLVYGFYYLITDLQQGKGSEQEILDKMTEATISLLGYQHPTPKQVADDAQRAEMRFMYLISVKTCVEIYPILFLYLYEKEAPNYSTAMELIKAKSATIAENYQMINTILTPENIDFIGKYSETFRSQYAIPE